MCIDHDWVLGVPVWYLTRALKAEARMGAHLEWGQLVASSREVHSAKLLLIDGHHFCAAHHCPCASTLGNLPISLSFGAASVVLCGGVHHHHLFCYTVRPQLTIERLFLDLERDTTYR